MTRTQRPNSASNGNQMSDKPSVKAAVQFVGLGVMFTGLIGCMIFALSYQSQKRNDNHYIPVGSCQFRSEGSVIDLRYIKDLEVIEKDSKSYFDIKMKYDSSIQIPVIAATFDELKVAVAECKTSINN